MDLSSATASTSYSAHPDEGDNDEDLYKYSMLRKCQASAINSTKEMEGEVSVHSASEVWPLILSMHCLFEESELQHLGIPDVLRHVAGESQKE